MTYLDDLEAKIQAATSRPWAVDWPGEEPGKSHCVSGPGGDLVVEGWADDIGLPDLEAIVAAVNGAEWMVGMLREAVAYVELEREFARSSVTRRMTRDWLARLEKGPTEVK